MHAASALLASTVQQFCVTAAQDSRNFAGYEQAVGEFKKGGTQVAKKVGKSGKQTQQKVGGASAPSLCDRGTLGSLSAGPGCKLSLAFHVAASKAASTSNDVGACLSQCQGCAQDTVVLLARRQRRPLRRGPRRLKSRATGSLVSLAASDTAACLLSRPENCVATFGLLSQQFCLPETGIVQQCLEPDQINGPLHSTG